MRACFTVLAFAALASGCAKNDGVAPAACSGSTESVRCVTDARCPDGLSCVGSGVCAAQCGSSACKCGMDCEALPLHCTDGACPFFEIDYCVFPGSAWFDAGRPDDAGLACTGPVDCFQFEGACLHTWADAEALPCTTGAHNSAGTCAGLHVIMNQGVDTFEAGYFLADSGALLAVVSGSAAPPMAQCNQGMTDFSPPDCALDAPLPGCDGG